MTEALKPPLAWNATQTGYRPEATVHGLFREVAAAHPDRIALVWDRGQLSYRDLDQRSDALADRLVAAGVAVDAPVALCLDRSPEAVIAALAVLKAGGAYLPLDADYPRSRLEFVVADAAVQVLVTSSTRRDQLAGLAAHTVLVDGDAVDGRVARTALPERTSANGRAYVMYTSGSTGTPKGVQIEHRSIVRLVGKASYVSLAADTCFLHAAPLGFDASTLEIWGPLLHGGRVAIYRDPVPTGRGLAAAIAAHGVTAAWLTAALFNAIVDEDPALLKGLRQLLTGGEALSPPHVRRALAALPGTELINGYGPTECTTFTATYSIPRDFPADATSVPIGRPIADTQVYVLDAAGEIVPVGTEGELYVAGLGLARGYLGRPDLDAERFVTRAAVPGERLYRTGDLVRWRADGVLDFVGRADQQVKVRGFRIELGEIEAKLGALAAVKSCAVLARDDGRAGKRLVAYIVPRDESVSIPALRAALHAELPEFMVPEVYVRLAALPVTANGKLDRAALPAPTAARPELAQPYRAPVGATESAICKVFADVLGLDEVGSMDGFFELGGNSLLSLRVLRGLQEAGLGEVSVATLFAAPTPAMLARALSAAGTRPVPGTPGRRHRGHADAREPIAIVGMAGRFPGATDITALWENLCAGRESIRFFRPEEIDAAIPAAQRGDPAYVPARGVLDDVELFDAGFFGISPLEAQLTDPQHRHFLETAWHALEHAAYVPEQSPGPIGVFGGMYNATYYQRHLQPRPDITGRLSELQVMLGNEKDYVTTRVAHKLGLQGPAVSVNTACSTSLVATTMAMDSLRSGGCDIALAGGVAITCPPNSGYLYQEGSMASVDGHTRTFDATAAGTVFSDGVAVVVLRRLQDAIDAGDTIYAVLLGGAVNNDGSERASFTAPSPEGQAAVIAAAHDAAGIDARSISYVEAHGTATPLGDPIEIEGLTRAFRRHTDDVGFCTVGSLKSNVGHMVIAAGASSVIKTALALHHEALPPSIGYTKPNPQIPFAGSPFRVQDAWSAWPRGESPRRAGVSSFGFGGTNAHVVMEEAPVRAASGPSTREAQVLFLSARSPAALAAASARLATALAAPTGMPALADVAHTLRVGRRAFAHRRYVVAATQEEAVRLLTAEDAAKASTRDVGAQLPDVGFLCPGQGSQYAGMGRGLYASEPAFRAAYDECCAIIERITGTDPRPVFFSDDAAAIVPTSVTQPAVFCLEYSVARLWMSWGVMPTALVGHSVGEFVCAALAGVMSLEDALGVVIERGSRMQALPAGSMLSVRLSAGELMPRLPDGVVIAAENAPGLCVASGPTDRIEVLERDLETAGVSARRLVTSHAFHSAMMDPVVGPMAERMRRVALQPPRIPIVSTVTADWLTDAQACDPVYWAEHLRRPVRFGPAVGRLLADTRRLLIEVGPRATLTALAQQALPAGGKRGRPAAVATLADAPEREQEAVATALGKAWTMGVAVDGAAYAAHEQRHRVALPGYPFERQRYWVDALPAAAPAAVAASPAVAAPAAAAAPVVEAAPAPAPAAAPAGAPDLVAKVRELVEEVSGADVSDADPETPWLELGLDSLTLTQLALQIQRSLGVKVTFRQVMEQFPSMASLAAMLQATMAPSTAAVPAAAPVAAAPAAAARPTAVAPAPALAPSNNEDEPAAGPVTYDVKKAFGAIARIHTRADELTPQQRGRLDALIARYTARTAKSKAYTAHHRAHMADPRVVNGFRPLTKELTYQLVIERSRGSRMWDLDGNEYVDVLSGFGMSMLGWQPDFLRQTIHDQVERGYEIGPQHVLAGETAEWFCKVTGAERAAFCNTGSEAVMGCIRIARTVTGRNTIAIFTGAYHGIFDEVIVRGTRKLRSIPAAPGIMPETALNVLVLDYATPETLQILRERADTLAAIVVEPVQSRRPDFQPVEFLREIRKLTEESGTLLVFDEVVTGFRSHPAGAQGLFGIQADLASYGKVVGGGFSIGVIAGKSRFMDALDGGPWQYGDDSIPTVGVTYFAGTFVRHPLALATAKAVLQHLHEQGPELQQRLTARTAAMVAEINASMAEIGAPFKLNTFASLWRNVFTEDLPYGDLIYAMLRDRGIHILDNFPCFLTTAHTDEDIRTIIQAYREAAAEMQASGFFPVRITAAARTSIAADGAREVPSTEPQREIWLASKLGREASLAYNESVSLHLRGELELGALRSAVRELVARHDALRSVFSEDGMTLRVPLTAPVMEVPLTDLSLDPRAAEQLRAITDRHVGEVFDLEKGPLVRAEVVRLAPDHHVLVFTGHHIVLDGWSYWVLVKELAGLYAHATGARTLDLEPAPSFADYAAETAAHAESADVAANVAWWTSRFADGGPTLALPTDRRRPRLRTQASRRHDHVLPAALVAQAKKVGAARKASLFATLLAGFGGLLHRVTGQDDIVVGIPAAGQSASGQSGLVGHCVSTLPLRLHLQSGMPFAAALEQGRVVMLDAYDHQDVTFGRVLKDLPLKRDPSRLPLVSVLFNIDQALSSESMAMPGIHLELESNARIAETFELFVNAVDAGAAGMRLECQYNSDLFDEATIARWMQAYQRLLEGAVEAPDRELGRLPVLPAADAASLIEWNQSAAEYPRTQRVESMILARAAEQPQRVALRAGGDSLTYGQLAATAAAVACALRERGVRTADRVGLLVERGLALVPAMVGTLRAGACYVPLDPGFPPDRLAFMVADAGLRAIATSRALAKAFADVIGDIPVVLLDELSVGKSLPEMAWEAGSPSQDAYVIYTSGSTGKPKGVQVPHRAVVNFLQSMAAAPGMDANAKLAAVTTVSFDIAVLELLLPLVVGAEVVLASRDEAMDGIALRQLLEKHQVNVMQATPATWRILVATGWQGGKGFKALCGGEPLPSDLAGVLLGRVGELWNLYGPTETTVWSSRHRVTAADGAVPIGRPIANTALHVLDGYGQVVPVGVVGELHIGGDGVTRGYLGREGLTAERFVADTAVAALGGGDIPSCGRLYKTGDLARWRNDGVLECLGRTDFQVKVRGYRIELGEIEVALAAHPAIAEAAVAVREDRAGDVRLVGYMVPAPGSDGAEAGSLPSDEVLRAFLGKTLPEYMVPQRFVALRALPLTPNGKVDRKALPAPATATGAAELAGDEQAPRNDREALVARHFQDALGLPRLGIEQDFFALGGHSLLAAQMCIRLGNELGRVIPMRVVFEHPTVAALAAWLDAAAPEAGAPASVPKRHGTGAAPLSLMQQRVWYLEQLQLGKTVFNVPSAHRLRGPLDVAALGNAFAELVQRQAVLRTVICSVDGEPAQRVLDLVDATIPLEDLTAHPEGNRPAMLARRMEQEIAQPFNLARDPLFRIRLFRLSADEHVLFFMPHHAIWDGWSFDLFYEEMAALYAAAVDGTPAALPALSVDYADFSAWQRDWMTGEALERQLDYWRGKLAGAPAVLELPLDHPRPATQSGEGATAWLKLSPATAAALRELGVREGATLYMTLLSAWALLLHRLTGQGEVIVGTPVRGRNLPELEPLMGFFVNALPLRLRVDPERSFLELLRAVRGEVVEAFGYQDVPFEHLVRVLDLPRDESRFPLYQAFFSYQDARQRTTQWGGLQQENVPVFQASAAQDLALWFLDGNDGLVGGLNFNTDILDPATAETLRSRYVALLDAIVARPEATTHALVATTDAELAQLREWNATAAAVPAAGSLWSYLAPGFAEADRVAIRFGLDVVTYGQLQAKVLAVAGALQARGVAKGDVVGLHLERSPDLIAALLGVLAAGATYLPLDPGFPAERIAFMLEDANVRLLVCDGDVAPLKLPQERVLPIAAALSATPLAPATVAADDAHERPAYLIYTSGSTGKPKGVRVPQRAVINFLESMRKAPGLAPGAKLAAVTTVSFDIAVLELLLPLAVGAEVVLVTRDEAIDGHALRKRLEQHGVEVMQATPATWRLLIEAGWKGGARWKALCGGEALPVDLAEALLERTGELWNMYGPTETTVWSTCARIAAGQGEISIGRPIDNTQVWILDAQGDVVPVGIPGEICIGGAGVALGYHARPELTHERFIADRLSGKPGAMLYRTGDLGRWRSDGVLQHLGRTDDQVKLRGYRIELGEIEAVLARHPQVAQAVVATRGTGGGVDLLVAYLVARGEAEVPADGLRAHSRQELPDYMVPSAFVWLAHLPLTPNGKVDRRALPDPGVVEAARAPAGAHAPRTPTERLVAEVWSTLLGVPDVAVVDNFLDLGGHSLLIMRAVSMLEARTGVQLSPRAFIFQTLGQIAAEYDRNGARPGAGEASPAPAPSGRLLQRVLGFLRPR